VKNGKALLVETGTNTMDGDHAGQAFKAELSAIEVFKDVPGPLMDQITLEMLQFFPDGTPLCHEGDPADHIFLILHGQVCISAGGMHLVARGPYSIIGEQAFINETNRSATVRAQGMVRALVLPRNVVQLLLSNPAFSRNLLRQLSTKLAEATSERAFRYRNEQMLFTEFRAHVSPSVANRLLATGRSYGEPRYIDGVILLSDIRFFTDLSASMSPEQVSAELGPYLDATVEIIHRYDGLVDKFIGDAVLAIWGYAETGIDLAAQALACAEDLVLMAESLMFGGKPISIGIGLNAGRVFIGNVGGNGKRQFTVLGTPVNLTARYEALTKDLEAPVAIGQAFHERLPEIMQAKFTAYTNVAVKGSAEQTVFTLGREHIGTKTQVIGK
jgi:class 3 adenylate cyclase